MASPADPVLSEQGHAEIKGQKVIRIGDVAPDFEADTSMGPVKFHEYIQGKWAVFFSHPRDFTPVCTTELGRVAQLKEEWAKRNVVVIALSVDDSKDHALWIKDINEIGNTTVDYPIIADKEKKVSMLYGMLDQTHLTQTGMPHTVRAVYIIDPNKVIRLMLIYPASTGRNFDEILRCVDSVQLTTKNKVATPCDWKKGGQCVILPTIPDEEAQKLFPQGFTSVRKYMRLVPDPSQ